LALESFSEAETLLSNYSNNCSYDSDLAKIWSDEAEIFSKIG
jgi:hypothetical protein